LARHVAAATACAIALTLLSLDVSAQAGVQRIAVRIYDFSALDHAVRDRAAGEARAIVADAGVSADWRDCAQRHTCAAGSGELVVRIIRELGHPTAESRRALGYAVIDTTAGRGTLATIYVNRVEDSAREAGADLALLLGRAIAHEIGHLILRTNAHTDQGLMRAIWTEQELARNQPEDWTFAPPDRDQIQAALAR
jgi:hypothetical protein